MKLSDSETSAIELNRWLVKWGKHPGRVNVGTAYGTTLYVAPYTVYPGDWVIINEDNNLRVLKDWEFSLENESSGGLYQ